MLERLRIRLASADALPQLALLGVVSGVLAGAVIVAFRSAVELIQLSLLTGPNPENYESLGLLPRLLLPTAAGLIIGLVFQRAAGVTRETGVVHVMERLAYHEGHLPLRNALMQFFGATVSIAGGQSVGREGPSVHLGAINGSLLGQWLGLPNNSIRTLVACGVAAGFAASFNTPLAGVIFAMEVVLMEYTLRGVTPVILAAVSATVVVYLAYGPDPAFAVPALHLGSVYELPYVLMIGVAIGAVAALFNHLLVLITGTLRSLAYWRRTTLAGFVVGLCALAAPQVMGIGYDTVNAALLGELSVFVMLSVLAFKLLATTVGIGLGLPAGLIGPTLVIGSVAGGAMGAAAGLLFPEQVSSPALYALIGMGAMMGGSLQAPLAALLTMLELTGNPGVLLPGMLAVVAACLTSSELFNKGPLFVMLMRARGLDYRSDPIAQSLRRVGVAAVMNRSLASTGRRIDRAQGERLLRSAPQWIVVSGDEQTKYLLPAADLLRALARCESDVQEPVDETCVEDSIDLLDIPALRRQLAPVPIQATLQEALEVLERNGAEALYVTRRGREVCGILTRQDIEANYRQPR